MKPSSTSASLSNSREEVCQRYLAACEASREDGYPDLDPYLESFVEPERSELLAELKSVREAQRQRRSGVMDPATIEAAPPGADTVPRSGPPGTVDFEGPQNYKTRDYVPGAPAATLDHPTGTTPEAANFDTTAPAQIANYDILGVLGRGAMGVVYKASQRGLKRTVALKMILAGSHASAHEVSRFRSEAESVAQLQHPNIVQIYEIGDADGTPFISLEFVDGTTLDKKVRDNPMSPKDAAQLCQKLAQAMDYAHQRGIIHRDLKPANVLLAADGTPKISDFGLAKRLENEDAGMTRAGTVLGTPSYMAPEQADGKVNELGPRSDVYSLGAVLYDLLTGRAPFRGTTMLETLEQVRSREPVPPMHLQPGVPRDLETICLKCLQKDRERRYQSAGELADDLGRFLRSEPILARPISRTERAWRWCKRNPWVAGLSAAVALAVVGWAASSSALAFGLKLQKDEADFQKDNAITQRTEADRQKGIALDNEAEAKKQEKIANQQTDLALRREKSAKATAEATVTEMIRLGAALHKGLQPRKLSALSDPEIRRMREQVLTDLRQSLKDVSVKIEGAGATTFGEVGTCQAMGDLLVKLGQAEEAKRMYVHGYELVKVIADKQPDSDLARGNLGVMLMRVGDISLNLSGDGQSAVVAYKKACDLHLEILTAPHDNFYKEKRRDIILLLGRDYHSLGEASLAQGLVEQASKAFADALDYRQQWVAIDPKSFEAHAFSMQAQMSNGIAASFRGDDKGVTEHFTRSLDIGKSLIEKAPKALVVRGYLAKVQGAYGDAMLRAGKADDARIILEDAVKNLETHLANSPDDLAHQIDLAWTRERLAMAYSKLGKQPEATKYFSQALQLRLELYQVETNNQPWHAAYLTALARAGKHAEAAAGAAKLLPRVGHSTELQLQLARCFAVCAAADAANSKKYADASLKALAAATRQSYQNARLLQTDPDLATLHANPEFARIVDTVKSRK